MDDNGSSGNTTKNNNVSASTHRGKRKRITFAGSEEDSDDMMQVDSPHDEHQKCTATLSTNATASMSGIDNSTPSHAHKRRKLKEDELLQVDMILARERHGHAGASTLSASSPPPPPPQDERNLRPSDDYVPRDSDIDATVHDTIRRYWGLKSNSLPYNPSPNPVSITRKDLPRLRANEYVATEKSDGVRYLLVLCRHTQTGENIAVMMDRACNKYAVGVVAEDQYFAGSIFDGELVWDANNRLIYLVFDTVACRGREVRHCNYDERSLLIRDCFDDPGEYPIYASPDKQLAYAQALAEQGKIVAIDGTNYMCMRPKPYYLMAEVESLWNKIQTREIITHANDGLIFTPVREPVGCRTHWSQFKWKPHHTIDLQLRLAYLSPPPSSSSSSTLPHSYHPHPQQQQASPMSNAKQWFAALFYGDDRHLPEDVVLNKLPLANACKGVAYHDRVVKFSLENNAKLQRIQQHLLNVQVYGFACIVECAAHFGPGTDNTILVCNIQRIRTDKTVPNNHYTVLQTLKNIEENISMPELLQQVGVASSSSSSPTDLSTTHPSWQQTTLSPNQQQQQQQQQFQFHTTT